ncbi:MAG: non-ribosomal peptide synthase/polyketide synthase, partial [Longimicrobiaceae bacterium]
MSEDRAGGPSGVRERLSHERRQELLRGMLQKRAAVQAEETIPRRPGGEPPPLSLAQQRLWLADRLHPGSAAYNMPYRLRLRGALDEAALRRSLDALVERHETLRTTFEERDGAAVQVVHPPAPGVLPLLELRGLRAGDREAEALRIAAGEALRPFDLARGPLLRSMLLRLDDRDHVLCFTMHHIVSDGWSMEVLVREISVLADAFARGAPSPLPELPVQYADFAVWQRGRLTAEVMEAQAAYWRERLAGVPPLLDVPTDHPRTGREGEGAGTHPFTLSAELSEGLRALSRREGTTLFMTVLAGWQALLGRYSGQDDVVVSTPIAGRARHETAGLIGFFVNNLVMRADLAGDPTWGELLGRVRAAALGAYANQDLPFERLVDELGVDRALPHTPIVQVHFGLNEAGGGDRKLQLGGLELETFGAGEQIARYDLDLVVEDAPAGIGGAILFRESLFEPATVARMARHLETLLEAMVAAPEQRLSAASLLRGEERARVLGEWSSTAPAPPSGRRVHERFAEQAARTPDAPAVALGDEALTYAELDAAANRLAHRLAQLGVGPEARVAVVLDPGPGLVVALLAVLKAGGAYLPLEPSTPPERLAFVLEDAGVRAVVARESSRAALRRSPAPAVFLDSDAEELARESGDAPDVTTLAESAAYLIYTSGSTGQPKGVVVEHRHLAAYVQAVAARLGLTEGLRHAMVSTVAADLGNTVLYPSLCTGGALHLLPREVTTSGERFAAYVRGHGIDVLKIVPSHLAALLGAGGPEVLPRRLLVLGGEASQAAWVDELRERAPELAVFNHYGPTETTVGVLTHRVDGGGARGGTVPLGRPLAGTRAYVLDRSGQPVPAGMSGELYVGGAQVARGYAGQPAQTAERFVPDGLGEEPGARLYRTGDRVRWRPGGELEFLGRVDAQVKVRGFRVELGEIEAALALHAAVREAVVVLREDAKGQPRLVAYVVAEDGGEVQAAGLREYLGERLPEYMVPAAVVALERLPLNANGKLDRRALPAPEETTRYVAPRTPTEEVLAGIWAEVLKTDRVGVEDSFFEIGGHSLRAMQVVARVRKTLGARVPMRVLFEATTIAALAAHIDGLRGGSAAAPPIEPVPRGGPLPLSLAQQRLWLVDRMDPGNPAYNMPYALRLRGALDVDALRWSLAALAERHEPLRTVFAERAGEPAQVIRAPAPPELEVVELAGRADAEDEAVRLAEEEALRPVDLARGPLLRTTLLRLGADDHVLLFTMHHIVSDGWSRDVLVREVSALYAARGRGKEPGLPHLPVQYADYAAWQRARLGAGGLEAQVAWWKDVLAGAPPLLDLPVDRPRTAGGSARSGSRDIMLSRELTDRLRALARAEGATLFMTLLAGWQALLGRWAGQDDVVVGTPVAGRTRTELEGLIGFFVNMLALRADLGGDPTAAQLLGRVRDGALGAYDHQEVPFERLVDALVTERSLAHTPLFQVIFSLDRDSSTGGQRLSLGGVRLESFGGSEIVSKFDLKLAAVDSEDGVAGALVYRTALFDDATADRMAGHLEVLLEAMAADPSRRLAEVPLLGGAERAQLLEAWNDTAADFPRGRCVHELFAEQAARTPDAPAVLADDRALTYAELERGANRLAHHLRRLGVGPEARVGLLVERSADLLVALLGILKAGGAYVPLDPASPPARWSALLADAGAPVLVTQAHLAGRLDGWAGAVVRLDADRESVAREPGDAPAAGVRPRNLAYVLYTSGSTGAPKGVLVEHRSVLNLAAALDRAVYSRRGAAASPRVSMNGPVFFDTSVKQWVRLLSGAAVCVVPEEARADARALAAWARRHSVEVLDCTPSQLRVLLAEGLLEDGAGLTDLLVAGEALDRDLWATLAAAGPRAWNLYGPTECTVDASVGEVRGERPTIGRPVANARLYVLDPAGQPAPLGVPGELLVGGDGVARGYLGQPALTAAKFVPDVFGAEPGARLYRTGDRARWLASGELEYLGRMDQQLKLRGFRIEPGEIEAALLEHAAVREAAVVAREDAPGRQRLVAYVVAAEDAEIAAPALREHLSARLPEYMVPAAYVALERFPLNRNGKLDRRALPAPESAGGEAHRAPGTATEEVLAGIWGEVLGTERVGVDDAFFELGGHSLLATRVVSRVREALGVELPLRAVFETPTVAGLAARIDALRLAGSTALPAIRRVPRGGPLPASFAQRRLWLVDRLEPGSAAYNMPAALRLRGPLDVDALRRGLDALVARHETLRTTLEERGGEPVQVIHPPAPVPLPMVDVAGEAEAARLAAGEARRPFDLAAGPLLRCALLRLAPDDHVVCFTLHHVVSDAWSNRVLVGELSALYGAFARGEEAHLPELPVQYADYAAWQRGWAAGELLDEQVGWWKERLAGAPPLLEIPVDRPRAPGQDAAAGTHAVALAPGMSAELRALARREGATLFMTVLAAWQALLGRWAGQDDVVVGTPIAGRTRAELEGLIGFFVNMLPLRAELGGGATWRELLARVREGALGAYAHQELPFERLVEELVVERSLAHTPLFQVTFSLERPVPAAGTLPAGGPALEAFGEAGAAAQFDLDLTLADDGDALRGGIRFRAALFEAATIARMAAHLEALLAAMVADPDARHAGVTLLPAAEREQVLAAGRGEARPFPGDAPVHELIAARAAAAPEAPAVAGGGRVLGYGELLAASGRLAARLRSAGVGPEVPVAVFLDRSPELGVALLAVLRAGGAFVPVDPGYPRERVEYLLADSGAPVIVTRSDLAAALPESAAAVLCVDAAEDAPHAAEFAEPVRSGTDALAYLVYTSGSTGRPKAAMVSHRSLVCYAEAMRERMGLVPADRVLQFASPAFDVMIEEVFPAWLSGACVVFPAGDLLGSPRELSRVLEEERVSVVELPTAFWHEWVRDAAETGTMLPPTLRLVLVGGERVLAERLEQWARLRRPLLHVFGLTETTVTTTTLLLEAGEDGSRWPNLPVGEPLANARVYVLDGDREPVPAGIPGELYVGGEAVARGYHARPGLTAERYVPDPFSAETGARLYRTGDRVRMPGEGGLEFLGRIDQQVKIRGYRIEPAEVEAVLCMHPAVRQAAVVVRPDPRGEPALVGYVSAEAAAEPAAGELRAWLRARLPEHMVPAALVTLEELPLTPNGKTDRRALPAPGWGGEAGYAAPRTAAGELLAGIWEDVLRLERVGADENFFELGGHSLLATQVVSRVRDALGVELPLRALFEAPTVAGLAGRVDELRRAGTAPPPPMEREPRAARGALPLSFAQQRLWLVDRLQPGSSAYNMPFPLRVRGELDVRALERALSGVVRRHESLRTRIVVRAGEPVQQVDPARPVRLRVADLGGIEPSRELERLVAEEAARPFDLAADPPLRAALVRLGDDDAVVLFTLHHVASDGWSVGVFVREVSALYAGAALPELPVQYGDYAVWQRRWLAGEVLEAQVGWWRERLAGAPARLELPTDHPRPAESGGAGGSVQFRLAGDVAAALRALSRREGATLFMTLLAAWQLVLARWSGAEDVVVGTPIAGRNRGETEGLIGFFVNTLVLRAEVSGEAGFRELLRQVRESTLGAYQHQDLPFEKLVEELVTERDLAHTPLFQVMFSLQSVEPDALRLGGARLESLDRGDGGPVKFDLSLGLAEAEGEVRGGLRYRRALWEGDTMARLLEHYGRVLAEVAARPERRLAEVPLLGEAERARVLEAWNATAADAPRGCVHDLFAEQARRTPDAPAVLWRGESMSYAELDRRANGVAHALRRRGVGPEARVALCLERGPGQLVAILAVLKAGGAYVPLDPEHPRDRLAYVLEDAAARVVLTQASLRDRLPAGAAETVCLEDESEGSDAAPASGAAPENLAYVIYTSGSTGRPKGVLVQHASVVNLARALDDAVYARRGGPPPRVAMNGPITFDTSVKQWVRLLAGAALCPVPDEARADAGALRGFLREQEVDVLDCTPAQLRLLGPDEPGPADVLVGGEAVDEALWRRMAAAPGTRYHNLYGPTECTVDAAVSPVAGPVPVIGRPVANARAYVLDGAMEPAPVGVYGELYVGGAGVARGYLGRPELTAERFVPDPFGGRAAAGARMYRTGDRVRWRAEGVLEYLGRTDFQVKLRGYRIEPGEVETVLREAAGVDDAAVLLRDDRLVAYVVASGDAAPGAAELRAHAASRLPEYMVPAAWVRLDALPLTPNGKLDRRALPAPGAPDGGAYRAPRTPAEDVLAGIYAEVLGAERVGAGDGFFELGGHSLLATRVVSRVREAFGVELPLRALFEAPTVGALAARIDALRGEEAGPQAPPLVRVPRDGAPLPLSFAQQRLWFIDQLEPGSAAYNMPFALRLRGPFDPAALERSLAEIVRRHETLRTVFATVDGEPVQVVHDAAAVALPVTDLRDLPDVQREAEVLRLASAEAARPFDLAAGPLLRASAVRLADAEWAVLFTLHHIVSDGWSMGVLVRELSALYAAAAEGRQAELPALAVQYADYAAWQRGWLTGDALEARLAFWREQLADAPQLLELPTDHPRPQALDPRGGSVGVHLSPDVARELRALSRREGATVFMTLLAAWQLLLARYAGVEDVSVGTPIAGRTRMETEPLIGFFVNTLVLRTDLSGEPAFTELLGRVRETTLGAYQHQEIPFERLVEELAPERSLTHTPLFQAMFALQNNERGELRMGGLDVEPLAAAGEGVARFDLTLALAEDERGVGGSLTYRAELWERTTMERLAGHFARLVDALVADPARPAWDAGFLGDGEREQLLAGWNATDVGHPAGEPVHGLVAAQARRTPDAVALVHGDAATTYAELDAAADRLAGLLRSRGVGPEIRVGVLLERTAEMVVALLAVLRAGGAYVPLDPAHPAERLGFVLADSGAAVLVTRLPLLDGLPAFDGEVVCMDADRAAIEAADAGAHARASALSRSSLAYVIYTSGSTGTPKGVAVTHGALLNLVHWHRRAFAVTGADRATQMAGLGFDASVWELWPYLASGAAVHLVADEETRSSPTALQRFLLEREVSVAFAPTPMAEALLALEWPAEAPLRLLLTGGDALRGRPREGLPFALVNNYGPTENTVVTTSGVVAPGRGSGRAPAIGRPIDNVRAYVLDARLAPVPVGVPGELCAGGAQVARGYLGRADLTAERFAPDPYGAAGGRLYRTGDRARWLASGEMEYLGRMDQQVKVRGFRIEPGEVEAVLRRHAGVAEAAVVARADASGGTRLVAYVVPADGEVAAAGLRAHLRAHLPEYMVPSALVTLAALPLTPSGKLDRRALAAAGTADAAGEHLAPRTPDEEILAGIYADVLRVERVGVEDGFFELGGHSLLATRVVSRVRQAFGVELPLRALFEAPTVGALAARIDALRGEDAGPQAPPLVPVARDGSPLPLSFAQQRLWFIDQLEPGSAAYNMPFALRLRGPFDPAVLERSLAEIVRRHEALRTVFATVDGEPVQVVRDAAAVALPVTDLRDLPVVQREAEVLRLASAEAARPFDLAAGPLLRASAVRLDDAEWAVLFTLHHIVSDGWSMGVLVRELSALYEEAELPALPVQYADYAAWQRAWLTGDVLEARLAFWREQLGDAPPLLELPTDHLRPQAQNPRGGSVGVHLSADVADELRALSRREGATVFMTLLAAWQLLLARYAGVEDVSVGTPIAGRTRMETEPLIGFFVNTLVLRTDLSGEPTFAELLGRVRETTLGAYQHQDVPFERLVEELAPERTLAHTPLFQAMFVLQNNEGGDLRMGELEVEPLAAAGEGAARFDLTLALAEDERGMRGSIAFRAELWERETMERMAGHFVRLAEAVAADPARPAADVAFLGAGERGQLLAEWNATDAGYPAGALVHGLFAAQAARTPDAVALVHGGEAMTYAELDAAANRLAGLLRRRGVGPESRVGVALERRPELLVALLGVLKAGGAYVPLDPAYPRGRLGWMIEDAGVELVVTRASLADRVPGAEVLALDAAAAELAAEPAAAPESGVGPENLSHVIFTSGSTGRPKGV